jgi:curved DNA-binding protein CbpA
MASGFDPYATLGVGRAASAAEIRAAYRALVARYHPDKHAGNPLEGLAAEKMADVNRAYEILSDARRRAAYDRGGPGAPVAPQPGSAPAGQRKGSHLTKAIALLLLLPLLIRSGRGLFRLLVALIRDAFAALRGLRGTPVVLALAVGLLVALSVVLLGRRRAKRP